jgi:hypothetical protein
MTDDWPRLALEGLGSLFSGVAGLVVGAWRWGRHSVLHEQRLREDYTSKIEELREDFRMALAATASTNHEQVDAIVDQFKETLMGIRRQIDEDRLTNEKRFLSKDDFRDFREEYREDMRGLKETMNRLTQPIRVR